MMVCSISGKNALGLIVTILTVGIGGGVVTGQPFPTMPPVPQGLYDDVLPDLLSVIETCLPDLWGTIMDASSEPAPTNPIDPTSEQSEGMSEEALSALNQYFRSIGTNTCDAAAIAQMDSAMTDFTQCTNGIDMMAFIEYFPSALIGSGLQCFLEVASQHDVISAQAYTGGPDQDVLSGACMEAVFGSNAMGDVLRTFFTTPGKMFPCFADLSQAVPDCLYATWPMPVVGKWLKEASCLLGSMEPFLEKICEVELVTLDECLDPNSADFCNTAKDACFLQPSSIGAPFSFYMMFPAQVLGVPMMDTCQVKAAGNETLDRGLAKYNDFVDQCIVHAWDWGVAATKPEPGPDSPAAPEGGSTTTTAPAPGPQGDDSPATKTAAPTTAATDPDATTTRNAGGGTSGGTSRRHLARHLVGGLGFPLWNHRHWFGGDGAL